MYLVNFLYLVLTTRFDTKCLHIYDCSKIYDNQLNLTLLLILRYLICGDTDHLVFDLRFRNCVYEIIDANVIT